MRQGMIIAVCLAALTAGCGATDTVSGGGYDADYLEEDLPPTFEENGDGTLTGVSCIERSEREYSCLGEWTPDDAASQQALDLVNETGEVSVDVVLDPDTGEYQYEIKPF